MPKFNETITSDTVRKNVTSEILLMLEDEIKHEVDLLCNYISGHEYLDESGYIVEIEIAARAVVENFSMRRPLTLS